MRLRLPDGGLDAGYAELAQSKIIALGHEGDLVFQICEAVVDRGGRQHQHFGFHAGLDHPLHQVVVAGVTVLVRRLVAEVVRLVDDDQVVVAPVHMRQIDIARGSTIARQVGVIQHIVVEPVSGKDVASIIGLVESPVVPQPLGAEHKHAIIPQLIIFDDSKGFEGFA